MDNIWLLSIAALAIGFMIGFLMGRSTGNSNRQAELAEQLESSQHELESYKTEVADHFEKTAALVNNLTSSYKDVHEHLATGAQVLCQPGSIDMALEPAMTPKLDKAEAQPSEEQTEAWSAEAAGKSAATADDSVTAEPPRDYAPKAPEEEGTLSETFGLKEEQATESENAAIDQPTADVPLPEEKEKTS
ncbi:MAG: hypothetical protein CSA60_03795 [Neptuniibacter caesariensis]|uniref:Z-ring associated protein G n=1 Tax=Neptuniibacter caesariensis TaxID=207954 RepID=A0A2G6JL53_NEPCE|nr:MAG: hypothetical protein CSA60_03795 [Neptuniibacter caesariensis]